MFDALFNKAIRSGVDKGVFAQPKGTYSSCPLQNGCTKYATGSSGGTKLAKKEPKPAAPKKEKKTAVEKKPVAKKSATAKKPAAKKATTTKAKTTATKKTAAPKKEKVVKPKAAPKAKAAPKKKAAAPKAVSIFNLRAINTSNHPQAPVDKPAVLSKTKSGRVSKGTTATPTTKKAKAAPKTAKKVTPKKA